MKSITYCNPFKNCTKDTAKLGKYKLLYWLYFKAVYFKEIFDPYSTIRNTYMALITTLTKLIQ